MDGSAWIREVIESYASSGGNTLGTPDGEPAWGRPLVGFSRGDDPLYGEIKDLIGEFHWTPEEIFRMSFPSPQPGSERLTVISWVLPHTEAVREDQRKEGSFPSE